MLGKKIINFLKILQLLLKSRFYILRIIEIIAPEKVLRGVIIARLLSGVLDSAATPARGSARRSGGVLLLALLKQLHWLITKLIRILK